MIGRLRGGASASGQEAKGALRDHGQAHTVARPLWKGKSAIGTKLQTAVRLPPSSSVCKYPAGRSGGVQNPSVAGRRADGRGYEPCLRHQPRRKTVLPFDHGGQIKGDHLPLTHHGPPFDIEIAHPRRAAEQQAGDRVP